MNRKSSEFLQTFSRQGRKQAFYSSGLTKTLVLLAGCILASTSFAQTEHEGQKEISSIDGIMQEQQAVTTRNMTELHFANVWLRRSYFNLSFGSMALSPKEDYPTGVREGIVPKYESNWAASLQLGRSYRLHKKPIANVIQFNIDYTGIDLNVSHIKQAGDGRNLYDSSNTFVPEGNTSRDTQYYIPWNLEKYEADYGMKLGPSITLSPFTGTKSRGAHFLQLHCYYHIGYQASLLLFLNDGDADVNQSTTGQNRTAHEEMESGTKLNWGHGVTQSFGIVLSWKGIGIGYEHRAANLKYKSTSPSTFGNNSYKFDTSLNRFFIQYRY